jgi:ABC-type microcin C transport system permease subunit YejB
LGNRQKGRLTSENVIHSEIKKANILKAINKSQNNLFKDKLFRIKKYYGNGKSYKKSFSFILKNMKRIDIHKVFYEKK